MASTRRLEPNQPGYRARAMRLESVMPDPLAESLTLPHSSAAPGDARRFIRRWVVTGDLRDALELLVSELVTNAVSYADGEVELTVSSLGDRLRVEVSDTSSVVPRIPERHLERGRGLRLVDELADCWGVDGRIDGKSVWFEIRVGSDPGPSSETGYIQP